MSERLVADARARGFAHPVEHLRYAEAGHLLRDPAHADRGHHDQRVRRRRNGRRDATRHSMRAPACSRSFTTRSARAEPRDRRPGRCARFHLETRAELRIGLPGEGHSHAPMLDREGPSQGCGPRLPRVEQREVEDRQIAETNNSVVSCEVEQLVLLSHHDIHALGSPSQDVTHGCLRLKAIHQSRNRYSNALERPEGEARRAGLTDSTERAGLEYTKRVPLAKEGSSVSLLP